jgi:predicted ester cyclase
MKRDLQLIKGGLEPAADEHTLSPRVRDLIRMVLHAFNEGSILEIEDAVSDHLLEHTETMGHVDFRQRLHMLRQAMPDAKLEIDEVIQHGNLVAWRWTVRGTQNQKMFGVASTGKPVTLTGISMDRLEGDVVVEHWEFPDVDAFYDQFEPSA